MLNKIVKKLSGANEHDSKELSQLYKTPIAEKGKTQMPTFQVYKEGVIQQSDLLFLPEDVSNETDDPFWDHVDEAKVKPV